ncbi:MAG: HD-GYP domain-containing protein [Deltaproteobacteria bacterium]|nr:HD-GYP domain-containing protein [Deltaproteobacteria bacterium]
MLKDISVKQLKIGMYIEDMAVSWLNHPFLRSKRLIKSEEEINKIKHYGILSVKINTDKGIDADQPDDHHDLSHVIAPGPPGDEAKVTKPKSSQPKAAPSPAPVTSADPVPLRDEITRVENVYKDTINKARIFLNQAKNGEPIDLEEVSANVDALMSSVFRNRYASSTLIKLKTFDEYTYTHSVNVCVLSLTLGRHLDFSPNLLKTLGIGAIFHDLGKTAVPEDILNKPGPLTEEEFEEMKKHSLLGAKILRNTVHISREIIECALYHHEKYNGLGYPKGLKADQIPFLAQVISLADVYDALTSRRVYRGKVSPHETLKIMYGNRGDHFNPALVAKMVKCLGVYPIGSMVTLETGEIGLVADINPEDLLHPQVLLLFDQRAKRKPRPQMLNLSFQPHGSGEGGHRIVEVEAPEKWDINPADYLMK